MSDSILPPGEWLVDDFSDTLDEVIERPAVDDACEKGGFLIGTPTEVADQIDATHDLGFDKLLLLFLDFPETAGMELFGDEVIPRF